MDELLADLTFEELSEHLNQWWKDRVEQTSGGNLYDYQYLLSAVKDNTGDVTELFNITMGILNRLKEAAPTSNTEEKISE